MRNSKRAAAEKSLAPDWRVAAAQLAEKIPAARLHPQVRAWIETYADAKASWAVAVSGGSDSVALLLLLWAHFPKMRKRILVLHYDHATRPDSSDDASFVREAAKKLGLNCLEARRTPGGPASEAVLRDLRCEFLRVASNEHGVSAMFFGHQRNDIAETMLMRLARGSGAAGLSAPRPVRVFPDGIAALRPLLDIDREELRASLRGVGIAWREDSSNNTDDYLRNRLRRHVLPAWQAAIGGRDLDASVARSRALIEEDDEALEGLATAALGESLPGQPLNLTTLAKQPRAVWRRVLHRWLSRNGLGDNLNARAFDTLLAAAVAAQAGRWSAGPGCWLVLSDNNLSLIRGGDAGAVTASPWPPLTLKSEQTLALPTGARLAARVVTVDKKLIKELKSGKIDPARRVMLAVPKATAGLGWRVRQWQPGDRYRPLGAPGRRKLQDLFTDKKIPLRERHRIPVVCKEDNEPVWAPGLPPAHGCRISATTRLAMELTYHPVNEII